MKNKLAFLLVAGGIALSNVTYANQCTCTQQPDADRKIYMYLGEEVLEEFPCNTPPSDKFCGRAYKQCRAARERDSRCSSTPESKDATGEFVLIP